MSRARWGLVAGGIGAWVVAACVGDDPIVVTTPGDAGPPASSTSGPTNEAGPSGATDAGVDAGHDAGPPKCSGAAFTSVEPVLSLASPATQVYSLALTADELEAYFAVTYGTSGGDFDIFHASRTSKTDAFTMLQAMSPDAGLSGQFVQSSVALDNLGTTLFFSATSPQAANAQLYRLTRQSNTSFESSTPVDLGAAVNADGAVSKVYPSVRGDDLYFSRGQVTGPLAIYRAHRAADGTFPDAGPVDELAGGTLVTNVVFESDGLTIFFGTDRAAKPSGVDVWTAHRPTTTAPFQDLAEVTELTSLSLDRPQWISPDDCRLYFVSNRAVPDAGLPNDTRHVWVATRAPK